MKPRFAAAAACVALLLSQQLLAAGTLPAAGADSLQTPSAVYSLIRVLGALALVFVVLFGGAWLFRNWQRLTVRKGRVPKLNILEMKSLGARHALYVIGYERQRFLLSTAPAGISLISALPEAATDEAATPCQPGFAETLARVLSGAGAKQGKTL